MAKEKVKTKRIVKANIRFISLCERGANTLSTIYKADDGEDKSVDLTTICKDMNEQGEIIACMYAPEKVDSQGDIASAAVIKEFAHDFQKNGDGIDIKHNEDVLSKDDVYVAESFIIQKGDERFSDMKDYDGNIADVTGGWGVILKVDSEDLRGLYRSGEWSGVSMGGTAVKKEDADPSGLLKALKSIAAHFKSDDNKVNKNTENDMALNKEDLEQVSKTVVETMAKVNKEAADAAAEKIKKEQEADKKLGLGYPEPVLKAAPTDEDLVNHRKCLEIFEKSKLVDPTDSRAVFAFETLKKDISASKNLDETLQKQTQDVYASVFTSNQDTNEIQKADLSNNDNDNGVAAAIEKSLDEAAKKAS